MADYVVILHGIIRSAKHMRRLAAFLSDAGFDIINIDYPSTQYSIAELRDIVHETINHKILEDKPVHLIGYSMGGLLVRALAGSPKHRWKNLGRVVQLAPPNHGSEVAEFWQDYWWYKKVYGPAGQELITDQTGIQHLFGPIDYELGVIAGDRTLDLISSNMMPKPNDGKVSVASTKIDGMQDHVVVHATHTFFPHNKHVQQQTLCFLQQGRFQASR